MRQVSDTTLGEQIEARLAELGLTGLHIRHFPGRMPLVRAVLHLGDDEYIEVKAAAETIGRAFELLAHDVTIARELHAAGKARPPRVRKASASSASAAKPGPRQRRERALSDSHSKIHMRKVAIEIAGHRGGSINTVTLAEALTVHRDTAGAVIAELVVDGLLVPNERFGFVLKDADAG